MFLVPEVLWNSLRINQSVHDSLVMGGAQRLLNCFGNTHVAWNKFVDFISVTETLSFCLNKSSFLKEEKFVWSCILFIVNKRIWKENLL